MSTEIKISADVIARIALFEIELKVRELLDTFSGRMLLSNELCNYLSSTGESRYTEVANNIRRALSTGKSVGGCKEDFDLLMNKATNQSIPDRTRSIKIVSESLMLCINFIYADSFLAVWRKMFIGFQASPSS